MMKLIKGIAYIFGLILAFILGMITMYNVATRAIDEAFEEVRNRRGYQYYEGL